MDIHEVFGLLTICAHPERYEVMAFLHDTGEATLDEVLEYASEFYPDFHLSKIELLVMFDELARYNLLSSRLFENWVFYSMTDRGLVFLEILSDLDERRELL